MDYEKVAMEDAKKEEEDERKRILKEQQLRREKEAEEREEYFRNEKRRLARESAEKARLLRKRNEDRVNANLQRENERDASRWQRVRPTTFTFSSKGIIERRNEIRIDESQN